MRSMRRESSLQPQWGSSARDGRGARNQQRSARANVSVRDSFATTAQLMRSLVAAFTTRLSCACLASVLTLARAFAKVKPGCLRGFSYGSTSPLPRSRDDRIGIFEALLLLALSAYTPHASTRGCTEFVDTSSRPDFKPSRPCAAGGSGRARHPELGNLELRAASESRHGRPPRSDPRLLQ